MEREPLLRPIQQNESPDVGSDVSIENNTTSSFLTAIKEVFSTKLLAVMIGFFMAGVCSSSIGALIGHIESFYGITDGPASFIFPTITAGYLGGAWLLQKTLQNYGWRGVALFPPLLRLVSSILLSAGLPFSLLILGYIIQGIGLGLADSGFCAWGSGIPYANVVQGMIHGCFAMGAILGPVLVASVARNDYEWYNFYRLVAILSLFEFAFFVIAFHQDNARSYENSSMPDSVVDTKSTTQSFRLTAVQFCAAFFFVYVGVENSFSGWSIEYMKRIRHLDPDIASLSSSIFWIGMTSGRLALGPITELFGVGHAVSLYICLSMIFQLLVKYVPSSTLSLGFLGINGFFLGPMYPSGMVLLAEKVSSRNKIGAVAAAAVLGQLGGALAPLAIGLIADGFGIGRMLDIIFFLSSFLLLVWFFFRLLPYSDDRSYPEVGSPQHVE